VISDTVLLSLASCFAQVSAAMLFVPVFSQGVLPARVRVFICLALVVVLFPMRFDLLSDPECRQLGGLPTLVHSFIVGAVLGLFLRLSLMVAQLFGVIVSQVSALSQIFGGAIEESPSPAFGRLVFYGLLCFLSMHDFHLKLVYSLAGSFSNCDASFDYGSFLIEFVFKYGAILFSLAVMVAVPYLFACLLYNAMIGFMNKAMPQLMVSFVGAPLLVGAFLFIPILALPPAFILWKTWFFDLSLENFLR